MKSQSLKKSKEKLEIPLDSRNSFLVETSFNSDIDIAIRREIDIKYRQSKTNSEYKFPRTITHRKSSSKQLSTKSFENLNKGKAIHKNSKSVFNPYLSDTKPTNPVFHLKFPTSTKTGNKECPNIKVNCSRVIQTERDYTLKSSRRKKSSVNKRVKSKQGISEILRKGKRSIGLVNRVDKGMMKIMLKKVKVNYLV